MSPATAGHEAIAHSYAREVEALQVASLFRTLPVASASAAFGVLLCFAFFAADGLKGAHVAWLLYGVAVAGARFALCLAWAHRQDQFPDLEPRDWARLAVAANFLAGVQWGLLGTWLFPEEPGYRQSFALMVITCFVGGSITAYAPVKWAHPALSLPATLPSTAYIFFVESGPHVVAGTMAFFFSGMVLYYALRETEQVAERLRADVHVRRQLDALETHADNRVVPFPGV
ncbi:MAG: hypothetical protein IPL06_08735 [Betaproteobacteria bacterium]|nr:hypothetical protein [Betaproteobacteria bacterium]